MGSVLGTVEELAGEIAAAFAILKPAIASPDAFFGLMRDLGWSAADVPAPILALGSSIDAVDDVIGRLLAGDATGADYEACMSMVPIVRSSCVGRR